jgi:hypothetical protein
MCSRQRGPSGGHAFLLGLGMAAAARPGVDAPGQPAASKRFAATFLRTFAGSQIRPFMAM